MKTQLLKHAITAQLSFLGINLNLPLTFVVNLHEANEAHSFHTVASILRGGIQSTLVAQGQIMVNYSNVDIP